MNMRRIIDLLNILALCAAFALLGSCGGKSDLDPEPEPEVIEENRTSDLAYCVWSELEDDVLELIYSRFTGKKVSCEEAKVVFVSGKDIKAEGIWNAYQRGAVVVVVSPTSTLLSALSQRNIGFLSAESLDDCLFAAFHRSGKVFSMDDFPPTNLNGLVSWVGDVHSANTSGDDLLQSIHLFSSQDIKIDKGLIFKDGKNEFRVTGQGQFEQYYSVIPLYAFKSSKSNYVGDFYIIDATFSVASAGMYAGKFKDTQLNGLQGSFMGYFLTGYRLDISLVDDKGNSVPVRFNQVPSPSTTINSQTYTSGVSWSFEAGLSGGAAGAGLSLSSGCNFSSSKTHEVRDLAIIDNSSDGGVRYTLEVKNLPTYLTLPPAISRSTFDFHSGWVWSVENTKESDVTTRYRMRVTLSELNYRDLYCKGGGNKKPSVQNWPVIADKEFFIDLPVPNRIPCGNVKFVNSEKGKVMTDIVFIDSKNPSDPKSYHFDPSGSVYSYQESYETSLPEGTYIVQYKLGGASCTGKNIAIKRGETLELQSGYYVK